MNKMIFLLLAFFSIASFSQVERDSAGDFKQAETTIREIKSKISYNLEFLERKYLTKLSYRDYIRAKDILIESYNLLLKIPDMDEYEFGDPIPMSDSEFSSLLNSIENESFESDKLSIIQISAKYNNFTVSQVIKIIALLSFSSGKIEAVKLTYPNVLDKFNSHNIINSFTYSADKEKVRQIISSIPER